MSISFHTTTISFKHMRGGLLPDRHEVEFKHKDGKPAKVLNAGFALQSFSLQYEDGDHHLVAEAIQVFDTGFDGSTAFFKLGVVFRDSSSLGLNLLGVKEHFPDFLSSGDHKVSGSVQVLVIAVLE